MVVTILALLAAFLLDRINLAPAKVTPAVRTLRVGSGTVDRTIRLAGSIAAQNSMYLRAPYMGGSRAAGHSHFQLVLEKLAAPGSQVRKGDIVAQFDRINMATRLDDLRSARVEQENNLKVLQQNIAVARGARDQRIRVARGAVDKAALDLKTAPVRSAIQVERFRLAFDEARANHDSLRTQLPYTEIANSAELRRAELTLREAIVEQRRAESNLDRMVVRAPIDGLVVLLDTFRGAEFAPIEAGDEVRPGQTYAQLVDTRASIIEAKANQSDVMDLRVGAPARVRFDAYPDLQAPARVRSISPLLKASGWRRSYVSEVGIVVEFQLKDPRVIPGLTVSVDVILETESSEAVIQRAGVFQDPAGARPLAYVKTESGWEKRDLELGLMNHVDIAVRSGLTAGEVIAAETPSDYRIAP
jgi:hypothetical protein